MITVWPISTAQSKAVLPRCETPIKYIRHQGHDKKKSTRQFISLEKKSQSSILKGNYISKDNVGGYIQERRLLKGKWNCSGNLT